MKRKSLVFRDTTFIFFVQNSLCASMAAAGCGNGTSTCSARHPNAAAAKLTGVSVHPFACEYRRHLQDTSLLDVFVCGTHSHLLHASSSNQFELSSNHPRSARTSLAVRLEPSSEANDRAVVVAVRLEYVRASHA